MARIKQLPPQEAQKIAAGEVVERPANAIKELLENAIDAGAKTITLYIEESGKKLIRVVDDGCGMDGQDAKLCFAHHATSKIETVHDLEKITTFGFRGEALSSVSSVSSVTLITKEAQKLHGTKVIVEQGIITSCEEVGCAQGTDISVSNLFYNVPARKKFLKSADTEYRHITLLFQAFCLDYLSIHFKLISHGSVIFNCPAVNALRDRVMQLWDHKMNGHMLEIKSEQSDKKISIEGLISDHQYHRYDRSLFYFFVNSRWVKNPALSRSLLKGYMNVLPPDKFPAAFIFINVDPKEVDINIHPRKEEVQFLHSRTVEMLLQDAIRKTLENHLSKRLARPVQLQSAFYSEKASPFFHTTLRQAPSLRQGFGGLSQGEWERYPATSHAQEILQSKNYNSNYNDFARFTLSSTKGESNAINEEMNQSLVANSIEGSGHIQDFQQSYDYKLIGQLHKTYLLLETIDGLFVIDQHAAHERILYEKFCSRFESAATVQLLFPHVITLTATDINHILMHKQIFAGLGLEIDWHGDEQLIVTATPVHAKNVSWDELISYSLNIIHENQNMIAADIEKLLQEKVRAQMACKAAVKAGDILTQEQMMQLLKDLEKTENRFTCPHGRPTSWLLRLNELERKFKRVL